MCMLQGQRCRISQITHLFSITARRQSIIIFHFNPFLVAKHTPAFPWSDAAAVWCWTVVYFELRHLPKNTLHICAICPCNIHIKPAANVHLLTSAKRRNMRSCKKYVYLSWSSTVRDDLLLLKMIRVGCRVWLHFFLTSSLSSKIIPW